MNCLDMFGFTLVFVLYSVSLWTTGFFQKRKLSQNDIDSGEYSGNKYYIIAVAGTIIMGITLFTIVLLNQPKKSKLYIK
jgi:hypothetical protein